MRSEPLRVVMTADTMRASTTSTVATQEACVFSTGDAVMRAVPARRAVTRPEPVTVAAISLSLVHAI